MYHAINMNRIIENQESKDFDYYCFENIYFENGKFYFVTPETINRKFGLGIDHKLDVQFESITNEKLDKSTDIIEDFTVLLWGEKTGFYHLMYDICFSEIFMPIVLFNDSKFSCNLLNIEKSYSVLDNFLKLMGINIIDNIDRPMLFKKLAFGYAWSGIDRFHKGKIYLEEFKNFLSKRVGLKYDFQFDKTILYTQRRKNRILINQEEVLAAIEKIGWKIKIVFLEDYSLEEQMTIVSQYKYIISVHGAELSWVLFMPENSTVIELSPYHFNNCVPSRISIFRNFKHEVIYSSKPSFDQSGIKWLIEREKINGDIEGVNNLLTKYEWGKHINGKFPEQYVYNANLYNFHHIYRDQDVYIENVEDILSCLEEKYKVAQEDISHLGGCYFGDGDINTYVTAIWDKLIEIYNPKTIIDIGCGLGHSLAYFLEKGVNSFGIEGLPAAINCSPVKEHIIKHDYTLDKYVPENNIDLAWCCEFVEHVEEKYLENFMLTFSKCKIVAMTHAVPGQKGYHHVNCQPKEYWIDKFKEYGFTYNENMSLELRKLAVKPFGHHVKNTLMIFEKL